ncbi:toll/interleukin-1 receptor domain-containing protein [Candidatus Entotheonella palauensis]|uniref:TIR domain-containing protein n=1 Tax=Candidatus Entotheonella gemina TaxID=1429439 RepID=W4M8W4_9BACT|nr:toll/interleukin-1 receptor domain-containing protein [Candidatus Entotheonella palauensis]ETX06351.1 MAG: hypothetical protein ETSY2_17645 [Candidatus Entotheonella gemina]
MPKVFISYNSNDAMFADLVKARLEVAGVDVWLDDGNLRPGEEWRNTIDDSISSSDALFIIITPTSCMSPYVTYEWSFALGKGIKVIPLLLEESDIHPRLDVMQHLNFTDQRRGPWGELIQTINDTVFTLGQTDLILAQLAGT